MAMWLRRGALFLGALLFIFPFYYMVIGSLQKDPDTSIAGAFPTGGLTLDNYTTINARVDLLGSLVNSGIFTGGVLLRHGRLRGPGRLRPGPVALPRAREHCSRRCCWCRSSPSSS